MPLYAATRHYGGSCNWSVRITALCSSANTCTIIYILTTYRGLRFSWVAVLRYSATSCRRNYAWNSELWTPRAFIYSEAYNIATVNNNWEQAPCNIAGSFGSSIKCLNSEPASDDMWNLIEPLSCKITYTGCGNAGWFSSYRIQMHVSKHGMSIVLATYTM